MKLLEGAGLRSGVKPPLTRALFDATTENKAVPMDCTSAELDGGPFIDECDVVEYSDDELEPPPFPTHELMPVEVEDEFAMIVNEQA